MLSGSATEAGSPRPAVYSKWYRGYVLALATIVYSFNHSDRGLMALYLEPIKHDLHLSDTQLGLVTGMAFALFYAVAGIRIARFADNKNRVWIAACSIGLWGIILMGSLFIASYMQLLIARVSAAVGEAGSKPATYSLVGDYFPKPSERTFAMTIYWLGSPISTIVSFVAGGWLLEAFGWRMGFFAMGIPAVLLAAILLMTVEEPRARKVCPTPVVEPAPFAQVCLLLWRQRTLRNLSLALILLYLVGSGLNPWYAAYLMRVHAMDASQLGLWLGLVFGAGSTVGVLLGGYIANRFFLANERGQLRLSGLVVAGLMPCVVAFAIVGDRLLAVLALAPVIATFSFFMGPTYAIIQRLVPDNMRASSMAAILLLVNLIGLGIGPWLVGGLSDLLAPRFGPTSLGIAMMILSFGAIGSAFFFWLSAETVNVDLDEIDGRPVSELTVP